MQIHTLSSSSKGNCALIIDGDDAILIDAGISARAITSALAGFGLRPEELSGILVTHEHTDHVRGLATLIKRPLAPIFAPRTVANHLRWSIAGVDDFIVELPLMEETMVGGLSVFPFPTPHDTPQSVGYRITGSRILGFCTDCGHVTEDMLRGLAGADAAVIEANHDPRLLMDGPYPPLLKRRILSDRGHLSNEACGRLALSLARGGARNIVLAHLSLENNTPALALEAVTSALSAGGFVPDRDVFVAVAPEKDIFSLRLEVYSKC